MKMETEILSKIKDLEEKLQNMRKESAIWSTPEHVAIEAKLQALKWATNLSQEI